MRHHHVSSRARLAVCAALAILAAACDTGRFPTCKDNAECAKNTDGGAPVCFDLRCVECAYDVDCAPGKVCGPTKTCDALGGATTATQDQQPVDAGAESTKWEPGSWDDCAKDCKDQDCIHTCDQKFPKTAASAQKSKKPGKK
ncbi:MAG TPA: hypothetical protein VHB21_10025 [Minicystis sp.]|nr:hypothetical protein [Minicystis sp.]